MSFAKSGSSVYSGREWKRRLEEQVRDNGCGHVWQWDPEDRLMRCYQCGKARLPTDADHVGPRLENGPTDF